jgi:hypothetical protein
LKVDWAGLLEQQVEMMKPWLVTCVEILLKPACVFALIVVKGTHVSVAYMMRQPEGDDNLRCLVKSRLGIRLFDFCLLPKAFSKAIKEGK